MRFRCWGWGLFQQNQALENILLKETTTMHDGNDKRCSYWELSAASQKKRFPLKGRNLGPKGLGASGLGVLGFRGSGFRVIWHGIL